MKKILTLILVLNSVISQNNFSYFPIKEGVSWRVAIWGAYCLGKIIPPGIYEYYFQGDTTIDGIKCKKLYRKVIQYGSPPMYLPHKPEGYMGAVYLDTSSNVVKFFTSNESSEPNRWLTLSQLIKSYDKNYIFSEIYHKIYALNAGELFHKCGIKSILGASSYGESRNKLIVDTLPATIFGIDRNWYVIKQEIYRQVGPNEFVYTLFKTSAFVEGIGDLSGLLENGFSHGWDNKWKIGITPKYEITTCSKSNNNVIGFSKLICFTENGMKHEFVPGGCKIANIQKPNSEFKMFPGKGAKWTILVNNESIYEYLLTNDTIINHRQYTKVIRKQIAPGPPPTYMPYKLNGYIGAVRNDSINRIVYFIPADTFLNPSGTKEYILYDFNYIQPGIFVWNLFTSNCLSEPPYNIQCPAWIEHIDSIFMFGEWRKRYILKVRTSLNSYPYIDNFNIFHDYIEVIEGIGNINNPFDFITNKSTYYVKGYINSSFASIPVICGKETNFTLLNFQWDGKSIAANINNKTHNSNVKTFIKNNSLFLTSENKITKIQLYNITGQTILEKHYNNNVVKINFQNTPNGIYIVKIYLDNNQIIFKKILK